MKLFIDSGNLKDIESLVALGIIDGVTTNPSLLAKEPGGYKDNLKKICGMVQGPTSAEVTETEAQAMIRQGRDLSKIDQHIVVKVPLTKEGIKACKALSGEGIKVNVTLCFSPSQALLAAKVGATYISPFVGRLDDVATPGMPSPGLVRAIHPASGPGVRDDGGVLAGFTVPVFYDSMIAKLVAWAGTRAEAIERMSRALREYEIVGIKTTLPFFLWLMAEPDFLAARFDTTYLDALLTSRQGESFSRFSESEERTIAMAAAIDAWFRASRGMAAGGARQTGSAWKIAARQEALRG